MGFGIDWGQMEWVQKCYQVQNNWMQGQTNGIIRIGNFQIDRNQVLGKGATGYVYKGLNIENNNGVAVKAIQMNQINNQVTKYLLEGEKKASKTIKNPYVIHTHDVIQEKDFCYIIMEQCTGGTLKQYIQRKGKINPDEAVEMFRKIVTGYISIIQGLFIHRDLKSANIMLRANKEPAIIDFGYCEMIMGKRPMIQYNVGSPSYMAPQSYLKSRYSEKSDIWALGIILYEMIHGKTLDAGQNIKTYFKQIENRGSVPINYEGLPQLCQELLKMTLAVKPEDRGTIHKIKYTIDKSLIPKMQLQMNKAVSDNTGNYLKPRKNTINLMNPKTEPTEVKAKSSIKEHPKNSDRQNKIQMNRSVIQGSNIPSSPKSQIKPPCNFTNSNSSIFLRKSECHPPHFQTISKKKIQFPEFNPLTCTQIPEQKMNHRPTLRKIISLPSSQRNLPGSMRII